MFNYEYNAEGKLLKKEMPDGNAEEFIYDAEGRMVSAKNVNGTTTLSYEDDGHLDRVTFANGHWIDYDYDGNGRMMAGRS